MSDEVIRKAEEEETPYILRRLIREDPDMQRRVGEVADIVMQAYEDGNLLDPGGLQDEIEANEDAIKWFMP